MSVMLRRGLLAALLVGAMSVPCRAKKPLSVLEYLGQRASRMAARLPATPDNLSAWKRRRGKVLDDLARVLGLPERKPMKAAVTARKEAGGLIVEDVTYLWGEGAYVSANVVRTKNGGPRCPGIVVPPGWLGQLKDHYYKKFVDHMARRGYVVLFIDDPHVGKRKAPYAGLYALGSAAGTQVMGIQVFDTLRGLDYMLSRPDVDPGRIGVAGLCQGSEQTWLAAALDDRFQFAVPVCGTTTYEGWARMPAFEGVSLSDPSPYVWNVLRYTDWDEINACIAPRPVLIASNSGDNWWPVAGYNKVLETMTATYALYGAARRFRHVRDLRSHDMTPYIPEIAPWIDARVKPLKLSKAPNAPCSKPEKPDFSMVRCMQRRIARQGRSLPAAFSSRPDWKAYRTGIVKWLTGACDLASMRPGPGSVTAKTEKGGIVTETLDLPLDVDYRCPAMLVHKTGKARGNRPAIIISHDSGQCIASPRIVNASRRLAASGYWVVVPEHASLNRASLRRAESRGLVSLYGAGDTVALPPPAMRVADDLGALRYLLSRPEIDKGRIVIAGLGVGGVDACLASVMEDRIAGTASIGATTVRRWAAEVAPRLHAFDRIMPYLPSILAKSDLDYYYAAIAPRPLVLVALTFRDFPESGFKQVAATTAGVYRLHGNADGLCILNARKLTEDLEKKTPDSLRKQLFAAARALTPPPGIVGAGEGLRSRATVDSSPGVLWAVTEISGCRPQLPDGYRLATWSFFNDNGAAEKGRAITPLVFRKTKDGLKLAGVGKKRTNTGAGLQAFAFEPVAGTDLVGADYCFGWHTGDLSGPKNAGVVEYDDRTSDRMAILTTDGKTPNQRIQFGKTYRVKLLVPRTYSIQAKCIEK